MLEKFICPDNQEIDTKECLQKCRLGERCMSLPMLGSMAKQRVWRGVPSTTQLLNGTYESFLKIITGYSKSPDELVFATLGTGIHAHLDTAKMSGVFTEEDMGVFESEDGVTGRPDMVTDEDDKITLWDYKVAGSFKVASALGLSFRHEQSTTDFYKQKSYVKDSEGNTTAFEKGSPKMIKVWYADPAKADTFEWNMQLNYYRIMFEKKMGVKIAALKIQVIVRDGGIAMALERGITKRAYVIDIPILDDTYAEGYFIEKKAHLEEALKRFDWDEKCSDRETWNGRKCKDFCDVRHVCKFNK